MRRSLPILTLAALAAFAAPAGAGSAWDEIRSTVFAGRQIHAAEDHVRLSAPGRPDDQRAVPIAVEASFKDGRTVKAVTLIVDQNPTPVAATFDMGAARDALRFATNLRLNAATDVRAIVEASDGTLYMDERFVKFAGGQASCSAPPQGDPQEIAANMGKMTFEPLRRAAAATEITPRARLTVSHPNHTGMVLDQITLLYVPLRIVTDMEVLQGEERVFTMRGSMTLSQNPTVEFDYKVNGAETMRVFVSDSDGASWERSFPIGQGS